MVSLPFHEIPTGLVFAGINTPDHTTQFSHIASKLIEEPTVENGRNKKNFVCLLQSKDCLNIKNMFKTMIEFFLENTPNALRTDLDHDVNMNDNEENENVIEDEEDMIINTEVKKGSRLLSGEFLYLKNVLYMIACRYILSIGWGYSETEQVFTVRYAIIRRMV
jgi:hypothetical protein